MRKRDSKEDNVNERGKRTIPLRHVETRRQEVSLPTQLVSRAQKAQETSEEQMDSDLGADHLAILFVCHRGRQSLLSILRGVNATRVPIGKEPLGEAAVLAMLEELVALGYLKKAVLHNNPVWVATPKAKELDT